jgi:hypothetical protein
MNSKLIAPCGMNCNLCMGYLREKNKCPGCRDLNKDNAISCLRCVIRKCEILKKNHWKYCSIKCKKFPCNRLKSLDKRYRTKYEMSMIENLENIEEKGIRKFIKLEEKKWVRGNKIFCVHNKKYYKK